MIRTPAWLSFACVVLLSAAAWGDVGVFTGTGQNLRQISTQSVRLVSIDVTIILEHGPFLFDGTVGGMDRVGYQCKFVLHNLTDKAVETQVGFPIDSQFARVRDETKGQAQEWVSEYGFIARDDKTTYHVDFQRVDPGENGRAFSAIFTWKLNFQPNETKTLVVTYRIPMSMTLAGTRKGGAGIVAGPGDKPWMRMLAMCFLEIAGYTTETGSSWSGNVEKATFTVFTKPFEQYLDYRGLLEGLPANSSPESAERRKNSFPVQHVSWYRDVQPAGWQPVENGIRWEYKDFKPKEPITILYYLMQYPRMGSEVDAWADGLLQEIPGKVDQARELALAEQVLLATWGKKPEDAAVRAYVEDQVWYHPQKDFSPAKLSKEQQEVLRAVHRRIEVIAGGK